MKLAFIGTGKIIHDALYAIRSVEAITPTAVWARPHSLDKARALADEYNIPEVYTDYDELLEGTMADTLYIGLVNNVHFEYARRALLAGKNVILEKPFCGSYEEALELQELALDKNLFLLEAITVLHNGVFDKMRENLPKIGQTRMFLANYSQYSSRYDEYLNGQIAHPFDPAFYGGALYDINVYNVHYCVGLFGAPLSVAYYPNKGYNGVDTSGTLIMQYDGFTAVCTGTKDSDSPCFVSIQGEQGYMSLQGKPNTATVLETTYITTPFDRKALSDGYGGGATGTALNPARDASGAIIRETATDIYDASADHTYPHRMTQEFIEFAEIIDGKDHAKAAWLLGESVAVVKVLDEALHE